MNVTMDSSSIELTTHANDVKTLLTTAEHVKKTLSMNSDALHVNSASFQMFLLVTPSRFQTVRQSLLSQMKFVMNAIGLSVEVLMEDYACLVSLSILDVLLVLLINMECHLCVLSVETTSI